jgi:signal transduction histidine kinase
MKLKGIFGRLFISNFIILVFLSIFMTYIFTKTQKLNSLLHQVTTVELPLIEKADRLYNLISEIGEFRDKYRISYDSDFLDRYKKYSGDASVLLTDMWMLVSERAKEAAFDMLKKSYSDFMSANTAYLWNISENASPPSADALKLSVSALRDIAMQQRSESLRVSGVLSEEVKAGVFIFILTGIALILGIAYLNTRNIVIPLSNLSRETHRVTEGTYPESIETDGPYEVKKLAEDFGVMLSRLKENDELKAEFIGNVSHELRTPLTSIREASNMLKESYFLKDRISSEKLLNIISGESQRMINSVNNILEMTRLDMSEVSYQCEKADVGRMIQSVLLKSEPIAEKRNIKIISHVPVDKVFAVADIEKISVVLINLLGNALKYSYEGGEINITAKETGSLLRICVEDNGVGISADELSIIFERYRQGSNKTSEYKGSGLGLAICTKILEKHGGKIWAESSEGNGSRFFFTLQSV